MSIFTSPLTQLGIIVNRNFIGSLKKILLFLFFAASIMNGAIAQNACSVTGVAPSPPYPLPIIVACANGPNLSYQSNSLFPSTYSWSIFANTSGASLVGPTTNQTVTVSPGSTSGSFFLICTVTETAH